MLPNLLALKETTDKSSPRFSLPQAYCEKLEWVRGADNIRVWLLQLLPGRYCILSESDIAKSEALEEITSRILNGPGPPEPDPAKFLPNEVVALIGRLIPTTLSGPRPSWRFTVPRQLFPEGTKIVKYVLLFSLGYLEIWHIDTYDAARQCPLDSLI